MSANLTFQNAQKIVSNVENSLSHLSNVFSKDEMVFQFPRESCGIACDKYDYIQCDSTSGECTCMGVGRCAPENQHCFKCSEENCKPSKLDTICAIDYVPPVDKSLNAYCQARVNICGQGSCDVFQHPEIVQYCVEKGGDETSCKMYMLRDSEDNSICTGVNHPDDEGPEKWTDDERRILYNIILEKVKEYGVGDPESLTRCILAGVLNSGYTFSQIQAETEEVKEMFKKLAKDCFVNATTYSMCGSDEDCKDGWSCKNGVCVGEKTDRTSWILSIFLILTILIIVFILRRRLRLF